MNPYQPPAAGTASPRELAGPLGVVPFTSVGELYGRALSLYFGNLGTIAGLTLVVFAPVNIAKCYSLHAANLEDNLRVTVRIEMLSESVFGALVTAALLSALMARIETGRALGIGEALAKGAKRWGNVFGARFRSGLYVVLGVVLLVVPGIVWLVKYALTDEIATLEVDRSSPRVLNRSAELTQGHRWKIFGVGFLAMVPVLVLQVLGGVASGLAESWIATAAFDSLNEVVFRFPVAVMLLVYLGLRPAPLVEP